MKRMAHLWLAGAVFTGLLLTAAWAQSDSLGDYARQVRKQKAQKPAAAKQFDNDNLPRRDTLSVVGPAPAETDAKPAETDGAAQEGDSAQSDKPEATDQATGQKAEDKPGEAEAQRQKFYEEWKKRIVEQKGTVDLTTRELDVAQREYRLRAAAFYADAGNRLRNAGAWDKEDAQFKQQIADKQKALDNAKQKLEDLQEEARKAGVPSSMRE